MRCEDVLELLPDYTLGTPTDTEAATVRRHIRGCAACRREAETLDQGLAMFASAAHEAEPPAELKGRVMSVLADEWAEGPAESAEAPAPLIPSRPRVSRLLAAAAVVLALAGSVTWGVSERTTAQHSVAALRGYQGNAEAYQRFLQALGGRDVRVARLQPQETSLVTGSAVLYDSDTGQSWVLVLARASGPHQRMTVTLSSASGRTIRLGEMRFDAHGDGSIWLVTSANLAQFRVVRLTDLHGVLEASGSAPPPGTSPAP
jgi:Putative zinc-finger